MNLYTIETCLRHHSSSRLPVEEWEVSWSKETPEGLVHPIEGLRKM